ncbi:MAG: calcium/sodium antiporter [Gemmatimonadetes bacterium]|nr:calcium/sodium antiporter [Gemmatimonadota bacterium]
MGTEALILGQNHGARDLGRHPGQRHPVVFDTEVGALFGGLLDAILHEGCALRVPPAPAQRPREQQPRQHRHADPDHQPPPEPPFEPSRPAFHAGESIGIRAIVTGSPVLGDALAALLGLIGLTIGAELMVRGASRIAGRTGIPPLVIGLTVVALGTSAPEIAVSIEAAMMGRESVALGNVVGSNIFNVLVILGLAALAAPLAVGSQLVRLDVPVMVGVSALPLVLGFDRLISVGDGIFLLLLLALYLGLLSRVARRGLPDPIAVSPFKPPEGLPPPRKAGSIEGSLAIDFGRAVAGLALLIVGADQFVGGATGIARAAGISDLVIGLTLVAAGTSMPELATSVLATLRGERDLAVGNVVGSNVFNVLAVLGAGAAASGGIEVPAGVLLFDFPVMLAVGLVCLPVFLSGSTITRWEGGMLVFYYALYVVYLGLNTTEHRYQEEFGVAVLGVVLPLTVILAAALWSHGGERRSAETG